MMRLRTALASLVALLLGTGARGADKAERFRLDNGILSAGFGSAGLARITGTASRQSVELTEDSVTLAVNGETLQVPGLKLTDTKRRKESVTYTYRAGDKQLQVVYELKPGWHFVSKQLVLTLPAGSTGRIDAVEMLRADLTAPIAREYKASSASGAVFLRLGDTNPPPEFGVFLGGNISTASPP